MSEDREALLRARVTRLQRALDDLKQASAYVSAREPLDVVRLRPILEEIELVEVELDAAMRSLALRRER